MNGSSLSKRPVRIAGAVSLFALLLSPLAAQRQAQAPKGPWMDASLAPDQRADMVIEQTEMAFQDARNYRVKGDRALEGFGFHPRFSIDDGIEQVKELVVERRIRDVENPRFANQSFLAKFGTHLA